MSAAYIALGSNLEPREYYMRQAVRRLGKLGKILKIGRLYESDPYGVTEQPAFLNSALILETALPPRELLPALKAIEQRLGRRKRQRWGPREIDLDIIFYGDMVVREENLHIPHDDYRNRRFVLQPLAELEPDFVAPGSGRTLRQALQDCPDQTRLKLYKTDWAVNGY